MKPMIFKVLLLILILYNYSFFIVAQVSPINDSNWELVGSKSDEFNSGTLNLNLWRNYPAYTWGGGGSYTWNTANVTIENGKLVLTCSLRDPNNKPYYYSGGIQSQSVDYCYGYFEIYAKLPGAYINNEPSGEGYWPAFWTYWQYPEDSCLYVHDEIDILEPSGRQYINADTNVVGWHDTTDWYQCPDPNKFKTRKKGECKFKSLEPLFLTFHKYSVEWISDRIIFYFDDVPFNLNFNDPSMVMGNQYVVIDLQIDGNINYPIIKTPLPDAMRVDYFHYYNLKKDCDTDAFINNNTELNSFNFAVKRNITFGNGSSLIYLSSGNNKTFRATNSILINGDFTVPLGCELNLIPTPCD